MTRIPTALLVILSAISLPLGAQDRRPCEIVITGVARGRDTTRVRSVTSGTGARSMYIGGIVDATCQGQGNRLQADSAEHFTDRGLLILYDNVRYTEPRMTMTSDRMFYYTDEERIVAEGNVRGRSASGTRFAGPQIEFFRAKPGVREESSWIATGRPFVRMSPSETRGSDAPGPESAADSTDLTANRVVSRNDSLVWASGAVVIEREDMRATADSATIDNGIEFAKLMRDPQVVGKGERPFALDGVVIETWSRERVLQRVVAVDSARAVSDSLTLTADTIDLRMSEQRIERIYSWGGRANADAPAQRIEADSMEIRMPDQTLDEVRAVGRAQAWSRVDTSRVVTGEMDWIAGDTIVARFEAVKDSAGAETSRMREVTAVGSARAFYQVPPSGGARGARGAPNLSYNRGRVIRVLFETGEMSTVTVTDQASGIYLEAPPPPAPPTAPPTVTDTAAARGRRP